MTKRGDSISNYGEDKRRGVVVAVTCIECGEIVLTDNAYTKFCGYTTYKNGTRHGYCKKRKLLKEMIKESRKLSQVETDKIIDKFIRLPIKEFKEYNKIFKKTLTQEEKVQVARHWLYSNCGRLMHDRKIEQPGTFDTGCVILELVEKVPEDFSKERILVNRLKKYTYRKSRKGYTMSEGDIVRGMKIPIDRRI